MSQVLAGSTSDLGLTAPAARNLEPGGPGWGGWGSRLRLCPVESSFTAGMTRPSGLNLPVSPGWIALPCPHLLTPPHPSALSRHLSSSAGPAPLWASHCPPTPPSFPEPAGRHRTKIRLPCFTRGGPLPSAVLCRAPRNLEDIAANPQESCLCPAIPWGPVQCWAHTHL